MDWHGDEQITVQPRLNTDSDDRHCTGSKRRGRDTGSTGGVRRMASLTRVGTPTTSQGKRHGAGTATARAEEESRDKDAVTHGRRQGRLSDNSVRQLRPTLDNSRHCGDTHGRRYVPSDNCQLRGGTHEQRYFQRVRLSTPLNNFRGYFYSPLTSLDSASFVHWF